MKTIECVGHFNLFVKDENSYVTNYGKHYRVAAFCPQGNEAYCRIDRVHGENEPSNEDILRVFKKDTDATGKWIVERREEWINENRECVDVYLRKMR